MVEKRLCLSRWYFYTALPRPKKQHSSKDVHQKQRLASRLDWLDWLTQSSLEDAVQAVKINGVVDIKRVKHPAAGVLGALLSAAARQIKEPVRPTDRPVRICPAAAAELVYQQAVIPLQQELYEEREARRKLMQQLSGLLPVIPRHTSAQRDEKACSSGLNHELADLHAALAKQQELTAHLQRELSDLRDGAQPTTAESELAAERALSTYLQVELSDMHHCAQRMAAEQAAAEAALAAQAAECRRLQQQVLDLQAQSEGSAVAAAAAAQEQADALAAQAAERHAAALAGEAAECRRLQQQVLDLQAQSIRLQQELAHLGKEALLKQIDAARKGYVDTGEMDLF